MRAPVYRHVDGQSTVAGVSLLSFVALLGVALVAIQLLPSGPSLAVIAGTYAPPAFTTESTAITRARERSTMIPTTDSRPTPRSIRACATRLARASRAA